MKIQFLINSLTSGGAEKVAITLFNELSKSDKYKIFFFTLEKDKFYDLNRKIKYKNLSNLNLKTNKLLKILLVPFLFLKYLIKTKKTNPDVLVSFLEISNFINILTAKILKKPVIISERINPKLMFDNSTLYGKVHNFLIKFLYPKADKIIIVSKEIEEILIKHYNIPKEKIKTIYNPHYINKYQQLSNESEEKYKNIFKESFVFINIGRLTEQKGQWFLIRAFRKVVDKYPKAKLIILGDGELKNKLQNLINKLNLQNNVYLLGLQKNPFKFLKHSDCFVLSSLWEGLPNTLIEALSLNLPVISTDCKTGPREILCPELDINDKISYPYYGKYGILTKPLPREMIFKSLDEKPLIEEEKMLADLMIKMIEDEKLREKYSNGVERARDFDVEKIIKEWEKIINRI